MKTKNQYWEIVKKNHFGSYHLFTACWKTLKEYSRGSEIDDSNAIDWLETIAAEKVNNPRSKFYIYG